MANDWLQTNRANWDERVPLHVSGRFYGTEAFRAGGLTLSEAEVRDLGPLRGRSLVHLQCHFGLDTLSWARLGADATGLDFSDEAIRAAGALARESGLAARFVTANVFDAVEALGREFDIVYTGRGALNWLPDLDAWARVVAALLRPGGELYLNEFHPVEWMFAETALEVRYDYFTPAAGLVYEQRGSYAAPDAATHCNKTIQWNHPLGEVVTALVRAGLEIRELREEPTSCVQRWPFLVKNAVGRYTMPERCPSVPLMYTLRGVRRETTRARQR